MATRTTYVSKDASAIKDTGAAAFDGWSGFDNHHPVGTNGLYKWRPFIYCPISFSGMTHINSAYLWVRAHRNSGGGNHCYGDTSTSRTLYVRRVTTTWGEGSDRGEGVWSQSEAYDYSSNAGDYTTTGQGSRAFSTYTDGTWYSIDITDIVLAWAPASAGGAGGTNNGVILINSNETDDAAGLEFYSEDAGSGLKPYIVVDFDTNIAPNAPTNTAPGSLVSGTPSLVGGLTPTFTGTFTDPDITAGRSDAITGVQVILYPGTTQTAGTEVWNSGTVATVTTAWNVPYSGPALTGNSTYNWIARQKDAAGAWSVYSEPRYIKPNSTPLAPTIGLTQVPESDVLTLTPTLNITHNDPDASDNKAYGYSLIMQYGTGAAFNSTGDITLGTPLTTTSLVYGAGTLTGWTALVPGTQYRWQARTKDSNGAWSAYSGWAYFTIHKTGTPTALSPVNLSTSTTLTPLFTGSAASVNDTITEVTIELSESGVVKDTKIVAAGPSGFSYTWAGAVLVTGHTYTWRAKLKTATYGYGDWSSPQLTFSVDTSGISMPLPTTNAGGLVTTLTPTFAPSRAAAFTYYNIEVRDMSGTLKYFSGDVQQTSATSASRAFNATTGITGGGAAAVTGTLLWNTQYQWRVRVSSVSNADLQTQSYTSYMTFNTDVAGTPTLTGSNINGAWVTTANPSFGLTRAGTDTIATAQALVYRVVNGVDTLIWDSGTVDVADATTATIVYGTGGSGESPVSEPTLTGGYTYRWTARYTKTTGQIGNYAPVQTWYQNAAPDAPTGLSPAAGAAVNGTNPTFTATFSDADTATKGDTPSAWTIVILTNVGGAFRTINVTGPWNAGTNTYVYSGAPALVVGTTYQWYTYFTDSKGVVGASSATRTFLASAAPSVNITVPSDESNVASNRVSFTYAYSHVSSLAQASYWLQVSRTSTLTSVGDDPSKDTLVYDSGEQAYVVAAGTNGTVVMPSGFTKTGFRYRARLTVKASDGIWSTTDTQEFIVAVSAPPAIDDVSVAPDDAWSRIRVQWTVQESAAPAGFSGFRVYRRLPGADDYTCIWTQNTWAKNGEYNDYYAGNGIVYEYMVTQVKSLADDSDIESPDSANVGAAALAADEWIVVGADRAAMHIFTLPTQDEEHERPVQQEVFEPVGSQRKVIARGAVLGHEGSIDVLWAADEVSNARIQTEYLYANRGPHILKSPFGDVWEVEFAGPTHKYQMGGHQAMSLSYIETSMRTSDLTYLQALDTSVALPGMTV